jgi:hypothetical protein
MAKELPPILVGFVALSADTESKRVLKIHFDHDVTVTDRAALVDAINSQRRERDLVQPVTG